jgi:hypothetical protein
MLMSIDGCNATHAEFVQSLGTGVSLSFKTTSLRSSSQDTFLPNMHSFLLALSECLGLALERKQVQVSWLSLCYPNYPSRGPAAKAQRKEIVDCKKLTQELIVLVCCLDKKVNRWIAL